PPQSSTRFPYTTLFRSKACGTAISARYPLVELATGLLTALAIWRFGATWAGLGAALLGFVLIALTFIDLDTQLLPDSMTMPLLRSEEHTSELQSRENLV